MVLEYLDGLLQRRLDGVLGNLFQRAGDGRRCPRLRDLVGATGLGDEPVRNTRGVTGFVGPGSKPVPLTDMEMKPLGIKTENVEVDFAEGDTVTVIGGVWKDTVGVIQSMNHSKQIVTINVELFGRETPVEISFADIKLMK